MNSGRKPINSPISAESKSQGRDLSSRILLSSFIGESKENYENYLAFMVNKSKVFKYLKKLAHNETLPTAEAKDEGHKDQVLHRIQQHLTSTKLPKIRLKAALKNLNLSIESAKALPHYVEEDKATEQCAQIFLQNFLSHPGNLQSVIDASYEKQSNVIVAADLLNDNYLFLCKIADQFKILKDLVYKLKTKEFAENIFVKLKSKQLTLFDYPTFDDLYNQTLKLAELSRGLLQLIDAKMMGSAHLKRAYEIIKSRETLLIDTIATTVERFTQNEPKEIAKIVQQDFMNLYDQVKNINEYQTMVAKIRFAAVAKASQAKEIIPSCLSFVTTLINDEKHCFVSISSPDGDTNSELHRQLENSMKKYGEYEYHLLSSSSKDAQVLIQKAVAALGQPHPQVPYRNCAEKAYVSELTKLIFLFGKEVNITGIANISFCPDVHAKNNKTLDVQVDDKVHTFDLMPCCDSCKKNKYAVVAILGAAAEYHTHVVKYREALKGIQAIARPDALDVSSDNQSDHEQSLEMACTSPLKTPISSRILSPISLFKPITQRELLVDQEDISAHTNAVSLKA